MSFYRAPQNSLQRNPSPKVQGQHSPGENFTGSLLEDLAEPGWHLPASQLASLILFSFLGLCSTILHIELERAHQ